MTRARIPAHTYTDAQVKAICAELTTLRTELHKDEHRAINGRFISHTAGGTLGTIIIILLVAIHIDPITASAIGGIPNFAVAIVDRKFGL